MRRKLDAFQVRDLVDGKIVFILSVTRKDAEMHVIGSWQDELKRLVSNQ